MYHMGIPKNTQTKIADKRLTVVHMPFCSFLPRNELVKYAEIVK